jgi:hypothetical membrane protein
MTLARRAQWTAGAAATLCVLAMLRYPGGTLIEAGTRRYSISQNFLSDLGMTVAYDGRPNRLGAALFVASMAVLVAGAMSCIAPIMRRLLRMPAARPWAMVAAACAVVTALAFIGVALTPENRLLDLHIGFTEWGWRAVALLSLVLGTAFLRAGPHFRAAAITCLVTGVGLAAYTLLFTSGPDMSVESGLRVHVLSQKAAALGVVSAFIILTRAVEVPRRRRRPVAKSRAPGDPPEYRGPEGKFEPKGRYRVVRTYRNPVDNFEAGEELVFESQASSRYDGATAYFFRDARGRSRRFEVYDSDAAPAWDLFERIG